MYFYMLHEKRLLYFVVTQNPLFSQMLHFILLIIKCSFCQFNFWCIDFNMFVLIQVQVHNSQHNKKEPILYDSYRNNIIIPCFISLLRKLLFKMQPNSLFIIAKLAILCLNSNSKPKINRIWRLARQKSIALSKGR